MITVKFKGLDKLMRDLEIARKKAIPYAIRDALNSAAFETRKQWQGTLSSTLTLRNTWTGRSVLVEKARSIEPRSMVAKVGSTAPYMGELESGAIRRGKSAHLPIPTAVAAGMAPGSRRTKLVRAANRLRAIQAARATGGASKAQRNAIALAVARKRNERFALLERERGGVALFSVRRRLAPRMLWDLSRHSVYTPAHPTLEPALRRASAQFERLAMEAVEKQLRFHRVLGR